ncbi:hypothetical protein MSj_01837 [Microcystis aeruginosa Sj]|uniref:Uncharacterized protein n=1 Tax=Microcystis aeruginosa Sj TaxID=1979544 RepID=A0A2Z6ULG8_MICAE|nr:hypothetical protein [Microcystis aeruginosa]GBL10349.1 hypothetical protein MSj_01837 [Microcystis aeruginosa Sj]
MNEKYGSSGRVSHSIKIALGFALAGAVAFPAATQAATNAQKQAAIDSLERLCNPQVGELL